METAQRCEVPSHPSRAVLMSKQRGPAEHSPGRRCPLTLGFSVIARAWVPATAGGRPRLPDHQRPSSKHRWGTHLISWHELQPCHSSAPADATPRRSDRAPARSSPDSGTFVRFLPSHVVPAHAEPVGPSLPRGRHLCGAPAARQPHSTFPFFASLYALSSRQGASSFALTRKRRLKPSLDAFPDFSPDCCCGLSVSYG